MSKHCFLDDSWGKVVCDTTGRFCLSWNMLISMQSSSNPSEDWSEHLGVGMYALMMIKDFGCIQSLWETCISKEVSGSTIEFLMSICCWHINDQKWRRISGKHIGLFGKCFQWKTWIKLLEHWASRSIRIDQKRLIVLSNEYIPWQDFEGVQNRSAKKEFLAVLQGVSIE